MVKVITLDVISLLSNGKTYDAFSGYISKTFSPAKSHVKPVVLNPALSCLCAPMTKALMTYCPHGAYPHGFTANAMPLFTVIFTENSPLVSASTTAPRKVSLFHALLNGEPAISVPLVIEYVLPSSRFFQQIKGLAIIPPPRSAHLLQFGQL